MSAVLRAQEPSAGYLADLAPPLVQRFDVLATAPAGVARLRKFILSLAVRGRLVSQDANEEPAQISMARIRSQTDRLAENDFDGKPPFNLPSSWLWVHFNELVRPDKPIAYGVLVPGPEVASGVPLVRISDLSTSNAAERPERSIAAQIHAQYRRTELEGGEILMGVVGSIGKLCVAPNSWAGANIARAVCRIAPSREINRDFVLLLLQSEFMQRSFAGDTRTLAQPTLNIGLIRASPTPVPPPQEQARIVARVDELMRLCDALEAKGRLEAAHHQQLLTTLLGTLTGSRTPEELADNWQRVADHFDLLLDRPAAVDALEQTILQLATSGHLSSRLPSDEEAPSSSNNNATGAQAFDVPHGWRWVALGNLTTLVTSGSRSWKDFYAVEGATFIRSQDIKYDRLEFDNRAYVKLPPSAEGVRTQVKNRDVLITITGANVGKAAVVLEPIAESYVSQHVALVRLSDPRLADYLHLWLVNESGGRRLLLESSYGAKPGLNLKNIKDLPVPVPPLSEQRRIVARVDQLRELCRDLRQRLAASQAVQAHLADALVENAATA